LAINWILLRYVIHMYLLLMIKTKHPLENILLPITKDQPALQRLIMKQQSRYIVSISPTAANYLTKESNTTAQNAAKENT
jgi:hypothetical protein